MTKSAWSRKPNEGYIASRKMGKPASQPNAENEKGAAKTQPSFLRDIYEFVCRPPPDHIEVVARVTVCAFLAYVLCMGNFDNVIPPSQVGTIGSVGAFMSMLFPTLLFSVEAIVFPGQVMTIVVALGFATMLLTCAASVGKGLYVAMYSLTALLCSPIQFDKMAGGNARVFIMNLALNSMGFVEVAVSDGQDAVNGFWNNPSGEKWGSSFISSIVAWCWIMLLLIAGRILPPFRTARAAFSKGFVPAAMRHISELIMFEEEGLDESSNRSDVIKKEQHEDAIDGKREVLTDGNTANDREKRRQDLISTLVRDGTVLVGGGVAALTSFEPRLTRFGPPECTFVILMKLMKAVEWCNITMLAVAMIPPDKVDMARKKAASPTNKEAANRLNNCAEALMKGVPLTLDDAAGSIETQDEECCANNSSFDPLLLTQKTQNVATTAISWIEAMGHPDRTNFRSYFGKSARSAIWHNNKPWLLSAFGILIAFYKNIRRVFQHETWKRIFKTPYHDREKFVWCIKFTIGMTALVAMGVYWEAFANLEVPVRDEGMPVGAHFSGWYIIAYAMSSTQTSEGTVKKGLLRLIGTATGGFSGWIALTACGTNVYGLVAWLTVTTIIATYLGLERGFKSRMGLSADYGYFPGYFTLTQALVVIDVFVGVGGKNDIVANRILANTTGIAMAIVLAIIPPGLWGGDPKYAMALLREEQTALRECLEILLSSTEAVDDRDAGFEKLASRIEKLLSDKKAVKMKLSNEANGFYKDSSRFSRLPFCRVDPKLKSELDALISVGSLIFVVLDFAAHICRTKDLRSSLLDQPGRSSCLRDVVKELKSDVVNEAGDVATAEGAADHTASATNAEPAEDNEGAALKEDATILFLHYVKIAHHTLRKRKSGLSEIKKWGI